MWQLVIYRLTLYVPARLCNTHSIVLSETSALRDVFIIIIVVLRRVPVINHEIMLVPRWAYVFYRVRDVLK